MTRIRLAKLGVPNNLAVVLLLFSLSVESFSTAQHKSLITTQTTTTTDTKDNQPTHSALDKLHQWADDRGIERKVQVTCDEMAGGGRGLIATEDIPPNEVVVKVPLSAAIRLEPTANLDEDDQWAGILARKLWEEGQKGTESFWADYISNLPKEAPFTPCRWNSHQRSELHDQKFEQQILENSSWRLRQAQGQGIPNTGRVDFLTCLDLVCSRTLKGRDGSRQLVPLMDIANHAPAEAGGGHFVVDQGAVYLMAGNRGVSPGEAVTLDYGGRSVQDFLLHYGFVPDRCFSDTISIVTAESLAEQEVASLSWNDCNGYRGHPDEHVRDVCSLALSKYPTTLQDDVRLLEELKAACPDTQSARRNHEAQSLAISYRYAKKSLLTSAVGCAYTAASSVFSAR